MTSKGARLPVARSEPQARKCNKCNLWTAREPVVRAETVIVARFGLPGKLLIKRVLVETRKGCGE